MKHKHLWLFVRRFSLVSLTCFCIHQRFAHLILWHSDEAARPLVIFQPLFVKCSNITHSDVVWTETQKSAWVYGYALGKGHMEGVFLKPSRKVNSGRSRRVFEPQQNGTRRETFMMCARTREVPQSLSELSVWTVRRAAGPSVNNQALSLLFYPQIHPSLSSVSSDKQAKWTSVWHRSDDDEMKSSCQVDNWLQRNKQQARLFRCREGSSVTKSSVFQQGLRGRLGEVLGITALGKKIKELWIDVNCIFTLFSKESLF